MLYSTACTNLQRMPKRTLLAILGDGSEGAFLKTIPFASWQILSYNPAKKEVCVRVYTNLNAENIQANIDALRIELLAETDSAARSALEGAIRALLTKLQYYPQVTMSFTLPTY